MTQPRTVLKYPGAKWSVADWIVSLMPPHKSYLEPFFGSGAVFFTKPPSPIETINDLDGEIVNLFTCIRDCPEELERAVALTPYSRQEYERVWEMYASARSAPQEAEDGTYPDVERARLTLVRYWQTHGCNARYRSGWKNDVAGREYAYAAQYWARLPAWIRAAVARLKEAQIERGDAVAVIRRFRSADVLIYADPPYVLSTRKGKQYRVEMEDREQEGLLRALLDHPGPVMVSGYESELYNDMLHGWDKLHHAAQSEKGGRRVETLWVNYEVQMQMDMERSAADGH